MLEFEFTPPRKSKSCMIFTKCSVRPASPYLLLSFVSFRTFKFVSKKSILIWVGRMLNINVLKKAPSQPSHSLSEGRGQGWYQSGRWDLTVSLLLMLYSSSPYIFLYSATVTCIWHSLTVCMRIMFYPCIN